MLVFDEGSYEQYVKALREDRETAKMHPIWPPLIIPGYAHKWVTFKIAARSLERVKICYSTSAQREKMLIVDPR